jgi:hypothetical protein
MKKSEIKETGFYWYGDWVVELSRLSDGKLVIRFPNEDCCDSTEYIPEDTEFVPYKTR